LSPESGFVSVVGDNSPKADGGQLDVKDESLTAHGKSPTEPIQHSLKQVILRGVIVAAAGLAIGFAIYQWWIFTPTMRPFQYTMSGITAGIFYAAVKRPAIQNGLAALVIWYVVLTFLLESFNPWLLVLNLTYLAGIAGVIYVYIHVIERMDLRKRVLRIAAMVTLGATGNTLIIVVLALILFRYTFSHPQTVVDNGFFNFKLGGLLGLGLGIGVEIAEYVVGRLSSDGKAAVVHCPSCGEELELEEADTESQEYTCPACGQKVKL
jgi:predicted RNA-binding Zn-ribbon protein involved in translation (DUF1610 family)/uncharacterized membrane protein